MSTTASSSLLQKFLHLRWSPHTNLRKYTCCSKYFSKYHKSVINSGNCALKPNVLGISNPFLPCPQLRNASHEAPHPSRVPLRLSSFNTITGPNIFKVMKNMILTHLIIRPYFDIDFSFSEFLRGARMAVERVSSLISVGNFTALHGLVSEEALQEIQRFYSFLSPTQRQQIGVAIEDVQNSFLYEIGILLEEEEHVQKRFVEITVCFWVNQMKNSDPRNYDSMGQYLEHHYSNTMVCNYRFIREFTKGVDDDWTINVANHFMLNELEKK